MSYDIRTYKLLREEKRREDGKSVRYWAKNHMIARKRGERVE